MELQWPAGSFEAPAIIAKAWLDTHAENCAGSKRKAKRSKVEQDKADSMETRPKQSDSGVQQTKQADWVQQAAHAHTYQANANVKMQIGVGSARP